LKRNTGLTHSLFLLVSAGFCLFLTCHQETESPKRTPKKTLRGSRGFRRRFQPVGIRITLSNFPVGKV
jgi:hypothetical protein